MNISSDNYRQFTVFILILVGISAVLAYAIFSILQGNGIEVPFYIEVPSILGIYAGLFLLFDKYLWRVSFLHTILKNLKIIVADDLNGRWRGTIKSSYDNFKSEIKAELTIKQTATQVKIRGVFDESKSISVHENFSCSEIDDKVALFYFFKNEPRYDAVDTMSMHEGSAILTYDKEGDTLAGHYYSGRDRNNHGIIEVKRVKE